MNEWVDSNVYFTIGKAMLGGKVLYRDIFDQKGPYLFMAHSFAYLISHRSFIGVYLLELALAFVFAYAEYRILLLYIEKKYALISMPVIMLLLTQHMRLCTATVRKNSRFRLWRFHSSSFWNSPRAER